MNRSRTARPSDRSRIAWLSAVLVAATLSPVFAVQEWPQFRGPTGQGAAEGTDLPVTWSETSNVAWKIPVPGRGWSSPVIAHGRVWVTTALPNGRDASLRLLSFDAESGRALQDVEIVRLQRAELLNAKNSHASPTPIADDERVYVHFGAHGTAAVALDGAIQWRGRHGCETQHGNGGSPVLHAGLLIFTCDGFDTAYLVALDARTGQQRWKTLRRQPWSQAYATPLLIRVGETDQLVSPGAYYAGAYDPLTGKEIWRVRYDDGFSNVPRPVFASGLVFIATGFQQPSMIAVRPDGKGDVTRSHLAWRVARGAPFTPSPIAASDHLYMVNDMGVLSCLDATTGAIVWQQRVLGNYSASPILAGGLIYLSSEEGVTTVFRPGPSFQLVAVNRLDGEMLASIGVAGRAFYIRTAEHLYRIQKVPRSMSFTPSSTENFQRRHSAMNR